jgi:hypothetical protein
MNGAPRTIAQCAPRATVHIQSESYLREGSAYPWTGWRPYMAGLSVLELEAAHTIADASTLEDVRAEDIVPEEPRFHVSDPWHAD